MTELALADLHLQLGLQFPRPWVFVLAWHYVSANLGQSRLIIVEYQRQENHMLSHQQQDGQSRLQLRTAALLLSAFT